MPRLLTALVSLLLACAAAFVPAFTQADTPALVVQNAWIRKPPGADAGAVYLTLVNHGAKPVNVVGVKTTIATHAMVHETAVVDGQSRMRMREKVTVAPGKSVAFAPEGLHVMLSGFKYDVAVGDTVRLSLLLEGGGQVDVAAIVRPLDAQ